MVKGSLFLRHCSRGLANGRFGHFKSCIPSAPGPGFNKYLLKLDENFFQLGNFA
jgi:hypothetical protein